MKTVTPSVVMLTRLSASSRSASRSHVIRRFYASGRGPTPPFAKQSIWSGGAGALERPSDIDFDPIARRPGVRADLRRELAPHVLRVCHCSA
jgi:hypothetical protein